RRAHALHLRGRARVADGVRRARRGRLPAARAGGEGLRVADHAGAAVAVHAAALRLAALDHHRGDRGGRGVRLRAGDPGGTVRLAGGHRGRGGAGEALGAVTVAGTGLRGGVARGGEDGDGGGGGKERLRGQHRVFALS